MATKKKMLQAAAGAAGGEALAIEDVFSTYLYTGNGSTQTITNGIDLAGEGGLVWFKTRNATAGNALFDTESGVGKFLVSNGTFAYQQPRPDCVTSFNSDGFSLGDDDPGGVCNFSSAYTYVSWTFRKAPRFFDVVTYTGTGPGSAANEQQVAHNLGIKPGAVIVKRTDSTGDWWFFTDVIDGSNDFGYLNQTAAFGNSGNNVATDTVFNVGGVLNTSGATYVAYLFAHDPLGPSGDGSDGLIACGSYTGNGSTTGPVIDLGWEPQWLLIKSATLSGGSWFIMDNMRGLVNGGDDPTLFANSNVAEVTSGFNIVSISATGFSLNTTGTAVNGSGETYIYIAIRRGPMRAPESGTEVFAMDTASTTSPAFSAGFPADFAFEKQPDTTGDWFSGSRLTGNKILSFNTTGAEGTGGAVHWDYMNGAWDGFSNFWRGWLFRRAPGFFDVVAYTGNGTAGRTVPHNLGVAPELLIVKSRSDARAWRVYTTTVGNTGSLRLNSDASADSGVTGYWNNTNPSDTSFTLGTDNDTNGSGQTYIAYLFATLPGVSKVGSYTGNGSSQTINCGFTSGARFVLIKRTDSTGDWYVWDTARGIVTGNDPFLELNTTDAEVTSDDSIDPDATGFIVNQTATTNVNVSSASYIFLAIA